MAPFDIESRFQFPIVRARSARVDRRIVRRSILSDTSEGRRVGNAELRVEGLQLAEDIRRVVSIDNGNRLSGAIADDPAIEFDLIDAVCLQDLQGVWPTGPALSAGSLLPRG